MSSQLNTMTYPVEATWEEYEELRYVKRAEKQLILARSEERQSRNLPTMAGYSDQHFQAMSQSYMIGASEEMLDQRLRELNLDFCIL